MDVNTLRIYGANLGAFAISLTEINDGLAVLLSVSAIVYTSVKIVDIVKGWKTKK